MKTKVIIAIILFIINSIVCLSQDRDLKFSVFAYTDPVATYKDGFNIGFGIDYQMNVSYFKAQLYTFPDLNGKTYTELSGTPLGFNYHSKFNDIRIYTGLKLGFVMRETTTFPLFGFEAGIDYTIPKTNMYIGLGIYYDKRYDNRVWNSNAKPFWRYNGIIKTGIKFN